MENCSKLKRDVEEKFEIVRKEMDKNKKKTAVGICNLMWI